MKKIENFLSAITLGAVLLMQVNISFANTALDQAKGATISAPKTFDGAVPGVKANIDTQKQASVPSVTKDSNQPQEPQEPGFLTKVGWDISNNKESYIALGVAAGFAGFLLGGPLGALIGIGAMFAFTISQRAWYIKDFAQKPS